MVIESLCELLFASVAVNVQTFAPGVSVTGADQDVVPVTVPTEPPVQEPDTEATDTLSLAVPQSVTGLVVVEKFVPEPVQSPGLSLLIVITGGVESPGVKVASS